MGLPLAGLGVTAAVGLAKGVAETLSGGTKPPLPQAKARAAAAEFETMFLEQMLDRVFAGAGEDGPLGENGPGGGVYRSMLVKEYAGGIAKAGGIGLSRQIYAEMLKLQEGASAGAARPRTPAPAGSAPL